MKRMKKYSYILLALPLLLGSCEAYLDVNPKSEVTDKELFSTAEGCEDAIYGIYTEMGTNKNLFAYALTFAYPELMTGNFTISQSDNLAYVVQRLWEHENAITVAENLWINGYKAIGYVNKALMHVLPKSDDEFRHIRLYKGELLALRAYLHFEMARIFAVPFASGDAAAKAKAIPYVTTYGIEVTPYSSLDKVFEEIVGDLTEAEKYLAEDEELVTPVRTNAADGFTSATTIRMPRNSRKNGLRILPTHVRILPGKSENRSAAAKNTAEKTSSHSRSCSAACGTACSIPTVKAVVAQRGMAKNGPMVR